MSASDVELGGDGVAVREARADGSRDATWSPERMTPGGMDPAPTGRAWAQGRARGRGAT